MPAPECLEAVGALACNKVAHCYALNHGNFNIPLTTLCAHGKACVEPVKGAGT